MPQITCFNLVEGANGYLSIWYPSPFELDGIGYCCAGQYIIRTKALTFGDTAHAEEVMITDDPSEMQLIDRLMMNYDEHAWAGIRQVVAYRALKAKFAQNPLLRERLLATGDSIIAECDYADHVWGIGFHSTDQRVKKVAEWRGRNMLGFALMIVREELREQYADAEQKMPLLHAFATRLYHAASQVGWDAVEYAISPEEMRSLGLVMDDGKSFVDIFGMDLGDVNALEWRSDKITDPVVLGSAIFSLWHYYKQQTIGPINDREESWFALAAKRLEELTRQLCSE